MKNNAFYVIVFVLALAAAYAVSQTQPPAATPNTVPPSGQQATQPDSDSPPAQTQDEPQNQNNPGAADAQSATPAGSDASIQKQVEQQFASQDLTGVIVTVNSGVVTLTGSVPSKEDRKRAKDLAKAIPGVRKVDAKLEVRRESAAAAGAGAVSASAQQTTQPTTQPSTAGSIAGNTTAASGTQAATSTQTPTGAASSTSSTLGTQSTGTQSTGTQSTVSGSAGVTGPATKTTPQASGTQSTTTGGVTGAATTTTTQSGGTGTQTGTVAAPTTSTSGTATTTGTVATSAEGADLQPQIESALKSEPTLAGSNVIVVVTGDTIELSGSVPTGKEKQTARRIASSFAGNRKVVDRITVTGRGVSQQGTPPNSTTLPQSQPDTSADPNDPNKPKQQDPNAQGDASSEPR